MILENFNNLLNKIFFFSAPLHFFAIIPLVFFLISQQKFRKEQLYIVFLLAANSSYKMTLIFFPLSIIKEGRTPYTIPKIGSYLLGLSIQLYTDNLSSSAFLSFISITTFYSMQRKKIDMQFIAYQLSSAACAFSQFKNLKLEFIPGFLLASSIAFFFSEKAYNLKNIALSIKSFFFSKIEKQQKNEIESSGINAQTTKGILKMTLGGNIDLGSVFATVLAVILCGRGVLFWMLVVSFISIGARKIEVLTSNSLRTFDSNTKSFVGGPYKYILQAFGNGKARFFSSFFTFSIIAATCFSPLTNQTAKILTTEVLHKQGSLWQTLSASFFVLTAVAISSQKNLNKTASIMSKLTDILTATFISCSVAVIIYNYANLIPTLKSIFQDAFSLKAGLGGIVSIIATAIKRVFYCNEVGMGTAGISHSNSINKSSVDEANMSLVPPVLSIIIIGLCSGLVVSITDADIMFKNNSDVIQALKHAFSTVHPLLSQLIIFVCAPLFAITTASMWSYYAKNSWVNNVNRNPAIYFIFYILIQILSASLDNFKTVMDLADTVNLAISIPNIIAILILYNKTKENAK